MKDLKGRVGGRFYRSFFRCRKSPATSWMAGKSSWLEGVRLYGVPVRVENIRVGRLAFCIYDSTV